MRILTFLLLGMLTQHYTIHAQTIRHRQPQPILLPDTTKTLSLRIICASNLPASNAPLWVVNSLPMSAEQVKTIHPDDILEVHILKDAQAAAIYGSRATYGAIVITLKPRSQSIKQKQKRPVN